MLLSRALRSSATTMSRRAITHMTVPPTNVNPAGKLMAHQLSMPKLPVPTLKETLDKYLTTVRPLLSDADFAQTQAAVAEFAKPNGLGAKLQQRLEQRAASSNTSWLYSWWNDIAYMAYRDPVVIYVSYFFQFYDANRKSLVPQTKRAAELVQGIMAFREKVVSQELTPEMARNEPLCSIQYNYMFNSCRMPVKPADVPATYDPSTNNHVLVLRKNQFFTFDAIHPQSGKPLSTAEIQAQLDRIIALAGENKGLPLGALTTANRDTWTDVRAKLVALHPDNEHVLDKIQSSVFALCLDDSSPVTREEVGRALWHGDGRNRWFDKSLQFVVFENGKAGFNGEHSMMDATPTGRLCEWVLDSLAKGKVDHGSPQVSAALPEPEQLRLVVDNEIAGAVRDAESKFDTLVAQHDFQVLAYDGYGKGLIKTFGVSPDAYVQLALQLAYYKMYGECRATYESAQTRKFEYGRTETGRSVSMESVAFVKAMADPNVPHAERVAKAKAAIAYHGKYMKDASEGRGVDRHLLGLRMLLQPGEEKPKIFTDGAYAKSCHWNLSTSQLTSEYFDGYGWGEVVPDGYGLAYMIKEKSIHVNIVSQHLGNLRFRHYLTEALQDMRVAFESVVAAQGVAGKSKL